MKKNYIFILSLVFINAGALFSQSTEDFEGEAVGASSFTDDSQTFNVTTPTTGETYDIFNCAGCGWNGSTADAQFIDNSGATNGASNGSSFTVTTNDGTDIIVSSLYIFCSTTGLANHAGSLTITGWKEGNLEFTITKSSGFSNVATLSPNNGFTYIDFVTEGAADYSETPIDELIFTSTSDLDYMALDAFSWSLASTLSVSDFKDLTSKVRLFPNPSNDTIQISNINAVHDFEIVSILGNRIFSGMIKNNDKIDVSKLSKGIYFLNIDDGNTMKFVKN